MLHDPPASGSVRIGSYNLPLPRSRLLRILIGVLLVTNYFTILAAWLTTLTPEFILDRI